MTRLDTRQGIGFKTKSIIITVVAIAISAAMISISIESTETISGNHELLIIPFFIVAVITALVFMYRLAKTSDTLEQQKHYIEDLLLSAPEAILVIDENGSIERANTAAEQLFGYDENEFREMQAEDLMPDEFRKRHSELRSGAFATLRTRSMGKSSALTILTKKQATIPVEISINYTHHNDNLKAIATIRDIRERIDTDAKLRLSRMIFENTNQPILITDKDLKIVDMNDAFCLLTGYQRSEIMHLKPSVFKSGKHDQDFYQTLWQSLKERDHWKGEIWNKTKHGHLFPALMTITAIRDIQNDITNFVAIYSDITAIKQQEALLIQLANNDPLTKLPNRLLFHDRILSALARAKRHNSKFAILYIDLDGFKTINDTLGHAKGDAILIETATALLGCIREQDTAARLGGDEFAIIIDELTDITFATQVTERIVKTLARDIHESGKSFPISASIGVAFFPEDGETDEDLTAHADEAMYAAKHRGRNQYCLYRDINP